MKKNYVLILAIALGLSALLLTIAFQAGWVQANPFNQERSGAPTIISYQGQILDGDTPYNGTGYFKFSVLDATGTTWYWSNDGTSATCAEPIASISLWVENGLFSVLLGDTSLPHMVSPLDVTVFSNPDTYLRVWFSDDEDTAFTQLPDQKIASVPYALHAQLAADADSLNGVQASGYQLQVTGSCPVGQAVRAINTDGTVICETIVASPTFSLSTIDSTGIVGGYSSMAIGTDGLGLISYYDTTNDDLKVAHCEDVNCTTATYTTLDSEGNVGMNTFIAIGSDGYGLISYLRQDQMLWKIVHCTNIACSTYSTPTFMTNTFTRSNGSPIAIGTDGLGLILYYDYGGTHLQIAHCNNIQCSTMTFYDFENTSGAIILWEFASIAIGSDGLGLISYYDSGNGNLKVAHCNNVLCSESTTYTLDSTGDVGYTSSITIGADGLGLISYFDASNENLKVAHCYDINCSGADIFTVDTTDSVGNLSSITIGIDGLGLISYYDSTNDDLKVAHCSNTACSSAYTYTLDSTGQVGYYTSIAIGMDGLGLISYFDQTNYGLKVAHCSNRFCNPDY